MLTVDPFLAGFLASWEGGVGRRGSGVAGGARDVVVVVAEGGESVDGWFASGVGKKII